ncbi:MAG: hypothetical protein K0B14_17915 [Anaerolineaceae bacterium]|nr:hypothetical protein [Anaerolineaceae bacterium]
MPREKDDTHKVTESEFEELINDRDDTVFIEYDRTTGNLIENGGIELDSEDEEIIGKHLINSFIDGDSDIMWARNERLDINYEFTRFESEKK